MEIDSEAQENVEALRSQVQQLKSDTDFSQQELELEGRSKLVYGINTRGLVSESLLYGTG